MTMKRLKWLVVFLVISFPSFAQQFLLVEDTVRINAKDYISPLSRFEMKWAAKYHGYYFCIFLDQNIFEGWNWKNRLLIISEDGKETVEVSLPEDFQGSDYGDLFVRHDTLYLRPYPYDDEQSGYYFEMNNWKWKSMKVVSDVIYDDDQYTIAFIDIGEWGGYTWFMENSRQYLMPEKLSRIIKNDNTYYFIRGSKVDTLNSLDGKAKLCEKNITYEKAAANHWAFLEKLWASGDLKVEPVPNFSHFTGREATLEDYFCWNFLAYGDGSLVYDTLFSNAFLTNGNIFYLVNTKEKTYIAQIEDGKLLEKFDLGHPYQFYRLHDYYRGKNVAPNQCFEQFEENNNSFGVLEIKDTLIHIRHIIHNQDSLPHIGTDHIESLLQYLLNHIDHLTFTQVDSVEKMLQATSDGEFRDLANGYYPDKYQNGKYKKYSYYTVIDSEKMLSVDYCVHKSDSVVKGAFFEWMKTRLYNSNDHHIGGKTDNYEEKVEEVRQILTYLTNQVPVAITDNSTYWMWTYHNLTIKLYEGGRMVMYLTEK